MAYEVERGAGGMPARSVPTVHTGAPPGGGWLTGRMLPGMAALLGLVVLALLLLALVLRASWLQAWRACRWEGS